MFYLVSWIFLIYFICLGFEDSELHWIWIIDMSHKILIFFFKYIDYPIFLNWLPRSFKIALEELAERVNGDMRMALNQLHYMSLSMSVINYDDIRKRLLNNAKDEDISPFTAVDKYDIHIILGATLKPCFYYQRLFYLLV